VLTEFIDIADCRPRSSAAGVIVMARTLIFAVYRTGQIVASIVQYLIKLRGLIY
jgi:hypothetical protein